MTHTMCMRAAKALIAIATSTYISYYAGSNNKILTGPILKIQAPSMSSYVQLAGVSPWIRVPRETRMVSTGNETDIILIIVIRTNANTSFLWPCDRIRSCDSIYINERYNDKWPCTNVVIDFKY